jgi:hypothetical protein
MLSPGSLSNRETLLSSAAPQAHGLFPSAGSVDSDVPSLTSHVMLPGPRSNNSLFVEPLEGDLSHDDRLLLPRFQPPASSPAEEGSEIAK